MWNLFESPSFIYKNRMVEPSSESKQLHEEKEKKDNETLRQTISKHTVQYTELTARYPGGNQFQPNFKLKE